MNQKLLTRLSTSMLPLQTIENSPRRMVNAVYIFITLIAWKKMIACSILFVEL